jgi:hypothetical protein
MTTNSYELLVIWLDVMFCLLQKNVACVMCCMPIPTCLGIKGLVVIVVVVVVV